MNDGKCQLINISFSFSLARNQAECSFFFLRLYKRKKEILLDWFFFPTIFFYRFDRLLYNRLMSKNDKWCELVFKEKHYVKFSVYQVSLCNIFFPPNLIICLNWLCWCKRAILLMWSFNQNMILCKTRVTCPCSSYKYLISTSN